MDCPYWSTREVVLTLLTAGIDQTLVSNNDRKTAYELAIENPSKEALNAFDYFKSTSNDPEAMKYIDKLKEQLESKYTFTKRMRLNVEEFDAKFDVPEFIFEKQRAGCIPEELTIFEHQIKPLMDDAFLVNSTSSTALMALDFTKKQAILNQQRRLKILKAGDESWEPEADVPKLTR